MSTDFPTAAVGSSQAPTATVEKSFTASNTKIRTSPREALMGAYDGVLADLQAALGARVRRHQTSLLNDPDSTRKLFASIVETFDHK